MHKDVNALEEVQDSCPISEMILAQWEVIAVQAFRRAHNMPHKAWRARLADAWIRIREVGTAYSVSAVMAPDGAALPQLGDL